MDTHALLWLVTDPDQLHEDALVAIGEAQEASKLFVSPITAWELAIAAGKKKNAPAIGDQLVKDWYRSAVAATSAKVVQIGPSIALLAADMIATTNHRDPGDCYIIATAKHKKVPVVSRDGIIHEIAATGYISAVNC